MNLHNNCDINSSKNTDILSHIRPSSGNIIYESIQGDEVFTNNYAFKKHMSIHNGQTPYQCTQGENALSNSIDLKSHDGIHTGKKAYQCSQLI